MKKHLIYVWGVGWIMFLIFIGHISDDLLLSLLRSFKLIGVPYVRAYIFLISIVLLITSYLLIASIKPGPIDKKLIIHILLATIVGAMGSVWLVMVIWPNRL